MLSGMGGFHAELYQATEGTMTALHASKFQASISAADDGAGRFTAELDPERGSLVGIHGGYQVAIVANAAAQFQPDRPVRTISTSFLRPGQPGAVELAIERIRQWRSLTTLSVQMVQVGSLQHHTGHAG